MTCFSVCGQNMAKYIYLKGFARYYALLNEWKKPCEIHLNANYTNAYGEGTQRKSRQTRRLVKFHDVSMNAKEIIFIVARLAHYTESIAGLNADRINLFLYDTCVKYITL